MFEVYLVVYLLTVDGPKLMLNEKQQTIESCLEQSKTVLESFRDYPHQGEIVTQCSIKTFKTDPA